MAVLGQLLVGFVRFYGFGSNCLRHVYVNRVDSPLRYFVPRPRRGGGLKSTQRRQPIEKIFISSSQLLVPSRTRTRRAENNPGRMETLHLRGDCLQATEISFRL